jgi:uncharacterized protein (UPF0548 family)
VCYVIPPPARTHADVRTAVDLVAMQHGAMQEELEALRSADLTYPEIGQTRGDLPSGYQHICRRVVVGQGQARFNEAAQTVLGWEMHRRAGLSVLASTEVAAVGTVAILRPGVGVLALKAPVR